MYYIDIIKRAWTGARDWLCCLLIGEVVLAFAVTEAIRIVVEIFIGTPYITELLIGFALIFVINMFPALEFLELILIWREEHGKHFLELK